MSKLNKEADVIFSQTESVKATFGTGLSDDLRLRVNENSPFLTIAGKRAVKDGYITIGEVKKMEADELKAKQCDGEVKKMEADELKAKQCDR